MGDPDQQRALDSVVAGKNTAVFGAGKTVTGARTALAYANAGGTGKTTVLHKAFARVQRRRLIVALNGLLAQAEGERGGASDDMAAVTLHSLLRLGERQDVTAENWASLAKEAIQAVRKEGHPFREWFAGHPIIISLVEISQWSIDMASRQRTGPTAGLLTPIAD